MSSWIVDKGVIDLLVEALFKYEIPIAHPMTPDELGTLLWKANYKGVNYRYHKRQRAPRYTHNREAVLYSDYPHSRLGDVRACARQSLLVYMQVRCYNHQSCDHPGYDASLAAGLMLALAQAILKSVGMSPSEAWQAAEAYPWIIYT